MNQTVIPIVPADRQRKRQAARGRRVHPAAAADVRALLPAEALRRDRLIEYLHLVNDRFGQLSTQHLAALAEAMGLAQTEVYEVASFYHHFDVVRDNAAGEVPAPPALTVRVCDGLACEMAGAQSLLERLPAILGADVRVIPAPCVGRCEQAPVAVVGQNPVRGATPDAVVQAVAAGAVCHEPEPYVGFDGYVEHGGYALWRDCVEGRRTVESVIGVLEFG